MISFTSRVGVAPGTTTVHLDDGGPANFSCLGGDTLCLPEPSSPYMTHSGDNAVLPDGGRPSATTSVPYGTESTLRHPGALFGLGVAPVVLPWGTLLASIGLAAAAGVGAAYYVSRRRA